MKLSYHDRKAKRKARKLRACYPLWSETKSVRASNGVSSLPRNQAVKRFSTK